MEKYFKYTPKYITFKKSQSHSTFEYCTSYLFLFQGLAACNTKFLHNSGISSTTKEIEINEVYAI